MDSIRTLLQGAKKASRALATTTDEARTALLMKLADTIESRTDELLAANAEDLAKMDPSNPLYDRLLLTPERLAAIAADMRSVGLLKCPLGEVIEETVRPNGLRLRRVRVPFGVIGMIYEARPNVTFDVAALCIKTANACVLKGGSDADASNRAAVGIIHEVLEAEGFDPACVTLLPATHEATGEMLGAAGLVDLCIPRGGKRLIEFVRDTARVPVIETGAGVVSTYVHSAADAAIAAKVATNAKTRRVSVCNALDTLLIDSSRLDDLGAIVAQMGEKGVEIHADERAYKALAGTYPTSLLLRAEEDPFDTWATEWMAMKMGVKTVDGLDEALEHIARYSSGHSEAIITTDENVAKRFRAEVDAACVYVNASTAFTDGGQFGLGAEIGISTQKLGPRGPMGLREITTYRWQIDGDGQTRP